MTVLFRAIITCMLVVALANHLELNPVVEALLIGIGTAAINKVIDKLLEDEPHSA